jgi:hypothetical protein
MESGAKWAAFVTGVALLALAAVALLRDWLDGGSLGLALPVTLGVLGALALGIGLSKAPLDPRRDRQPHDRVDAAEDKTGREWPNAADCGRRLRWRRQCSEYAVSAGAAA